MPLDFQATKELIAHRRSIKPVDMDAEKEVSREIILELAECANWAPSHGLTEPWRLHVFQGDSRQKFVTNLQRIYKEETAEVLFKPEKLVKMGANPMFANAVMAIVMKRDETGKIPEIEEVEAVACAVQNLHLAASALGLGVFWSSPPVSYGEGMAKFLELGENDKCLGFLYVGWPKDGKKWPVSRRASAGDKLVWS